MSKMWSCQKNKGYRKLFSHVKQKHTDFADQIFSSISKLDVTIPGWDEKPLWLAGLGYLDWSTIFVCFNEITLFIFKRNITNVVSITGKDCSTNQILAVFLGVPLVGCASNRLNLAVNTLLEDDYSVILGKMNNVMKKLSALKRRGSLRLVTPLAPITRIVTRWSSTYMMMKRVLELNEFLNALDKDIALYIPSAAEMIVIRYLTSNLAKLETLA